MSYTMPHKAILGALEQLRLGTGPKVELWPLQTLDKDQNGTLWFTLGVWSEGFRRVLTLHFDRTTEVRLPGPAYLRECQPQIVEAIRSFWDGSTSVPSRIVSVPTLSCAGTRPAAPL